MHTNNDLFSDVVHYAWVLLKFSCGWFDRNFNAVLKWIEQDLSSDWQSNSIVQNWIYWLW